MMDIGEMRVGMTYRRMHVTMLVRLVSRVGSVVLVAMMRVVHVPVTVLDRQVLVQMRVSLGDVQPHAPRHQSGGDAE